MKKTYLLIILSTIIVLVAILILLNSNKLIQKSPGLDENETRSCNTLFYNGNGKINLVFFSSQKEAEQYSNVLFEVEPFKTNKNNFNVFYIDNYKPECELYKEVALLCYSKEIIKKASSCPNDYIIVPDSQPISIRSSSFMNVVSINKEHPKIVLAHELGHALANLAEEYVPASILPKSKNCASECSLFSSNQCFQGCSDATYYRSTESGIMRTLSSDTYGEFDESLIQQIIDQKIASKKTTLTGNAIQDNLECKNQQYYLISGVLQDGQIKVTDKLEVVVDRDSVLEESKSFYEVINPIIYKFPEIFYGKGIK